MDRTPIPRSYNTVARLRQIMNICPRSQSSEIMGTLYNRSFIDHRTVDIRLRLSIRESTVSIFERTLHRVKPPDVRVCSLENTQSVMNTPYTGEDQPVYGCGY